MLPKFLIRSVVVILFTSLSFMTFMLPAQAEAIDPYLRRYLQVTEPVAMEMNAQGDTRLFSPEGLHEGKELFKEHCLNCHVGGSTLPYPPVSLSLEDLSGATPPRNNIEGLVAYMRTPMNYDGTEEIYWCREVPESWLPSEQVENIAAFILRAAQKAPGWGTETFKG
jgi:photosystem II cytochrome c550